MLRSLYPPTNPGSRRTLCIENKEFILEASLAEKLTPLCGVISIEIFNKSLSGQSGYYFAILAG